MKSKKMAGLLLALPLSASTLAGCADEISNTADGGTDVLGAARTEDNTAQDNAIESNSTDVSSNIQTTDNSSDTSGASNTTASTGALGSNLVLNPSFEDSDTSMWNVTYEGSSNPTDYQVKADDAHSGDISFHFWSDDKIDFDISQEFTDLEAGTYNLTAYFQGGNINADSILELYAIADGDVVYSADFKALGWLVWQMPEIPNISVTDGTLKIGVKVKCNEKGWGTVDDFSLNKVD